MRSEAGADISEDLVAGILTRRPRQVARGISFVEAGGEGQRELVRRLFPHVGRARTIGITGPPGAGKSTLVDRIARRLRQGGESVGILAVDPSSPFSGGAILGDRIRMQKLYTDPGVYIRSMATRGALGGLARATRDAVDLLDAAGFDSILVETVGVGQDEVDVVRSVDTVVVVVVPGLGDDIQAIKAGLMEIADLFVVNKADRRGVERTVRDLEMLLGLEESADGWRPPILRTVASRGEGIDELVEQLAAHRRALEEEGTLQTRRREQLRLRVETILQERILEAAEERIGLARAVAEGQARGADPYRVAEDLFERVLAPREAGS